MRKANAFLIGLPFNQARLELSRSALTHRLTLSERERHIEHICKKGDLLDILKVAEGSLHRTSPTDHHRMEESLQVVLARGFHDRFAPSRTASTKTLSAMVGVLFCALSLGAVHSGMVGWSTAHYIALPALALSSLLISAAYLEARMSLLPMTRMAVGLLDSGNLTSPHARALILDAVARWGRPSALPPELEVELCRSVRITLPDLPPSP